MTLSIKIIFLFFFLYIIYRIPVEMQDDEDINEITPAEIWMDKQMLFIIQNVLYNVGDLMLINK